MKFIEIFTYVNSEKMPYKYDCKHFRQISGTGVGPPDLPFLFKETACLRCEEKLQFKHFYAKWLETTHP